MKQQKILILSINQELRSVFYKTLQKDNFDLTFSDKGEQVFDDIIKENYNLILFDPTLPGLGGMNFVIELRKNDIFTPFVIITEDRTHQFELEAFRLGAMDFISGNCTAEAMSSILDKYSKIYLRPKKLDYLGSIQLVSKKTKFILDSNFDNIHSFISILIHELEDLPNISADDLLGIKIIFYELITNALEHGNAGISYKEKMNLLLAEDRDYMEYVKKKCIESCKKVYVGIEYSPGQIEIVIEDEGDGFDLSEIPEPTSEQYESGVSGRGIFITRMNIDSLTYNEKGNKAICLKKLNKNKPLKPDSSR